MIQSKNPIKSWKYGKSIVNRTKEKTVWGKSIKCSRYKCKCGKFFNFYEGKKSTWTIPKTTSK